MRRHTKKKGENGEICRDLRELWGFINVQGHDGGNKEGDIAIGGQIRKCG